MCNFVKHSEFRDAIHEYSFSCFLFFFVVFFLLFKYSLATFPMQISYIDF